eukprot:TRINITY_DN469_c0_g1_i5.p2 TRINITY_DN469_c0_g1~~TRINITY_DN469_c0_g1_i5.p2  ORF type:complete len:213 (+),score=51.49 TRINITY_DN469_c0_g1_i5:1094-1732(+)
MRDQRLQHRHFTKASPSPRFCLAACADSEVLEELGYGSSPRVYVHRPSRYSDAQYDRPKARFPGSAVKADVLATWIPKATLPLVGALTPLSEPRYRAAGLPQVTLYTTVDADAQAAAFDKYAADLRPIADKYRKQLLFNIADSEFMGDAMGGAVDSGAVSEPTVVIHGKGGAQHGMREAFSSKALQSHVHRFVDGTLQASNEEKQLAGQDEL